MINIETEDKSEKPDENKQETQKPDDKSGILFQGFLKITDPETGEIYVQGRA